MCSPRSMVRCPRSLASSGLMPKSVERFSFKANPTSQTNDQHSALPTKAIARVEPHFRKMLPIPRANSDSEGPARPVGSCAIDLRIWHRG